MVGSDNGGHTAKKGQTQTRFTFVLLQKKVSSLMKVVVSQRVFSTEGGSVVMKGYLI